jgi:uncharacterized membrane protein
MNIKGAYSLNVIKRALDNTLAIGIVWFGLGIALTICFALYEAVILNTTVNLQTALVYGFGIITVIMAVMLVVAIIINSGLNKLTKKQLRNS